MRLLPLSTCSSGLGANELADSSPSSRRRSTFPLRLSSPVAWLLVVCWTLGGGAHDGWAQQQVVTMKTGVQHEGQLLQLTAYSPTAFGFLPFTKSSSKIVVIDDGLRTVHVCRENLARTGDSARAESEYDIPQNIYTGNNPGRGALVRTSAFNEFGHREFIVREKNAGGVKTRTYIQGVTKITPRYCELETLVGAKQVLRRWDMSVATNSVPKDVLRRLLLNRLGRDNVNVNDYLDVADFFRQAQDFEQARFEYQNILEKFPDQKQRVSDLKLQLNQLIGRQVLAEVKTRIEVGQTVLGTSLAKAQGKQVMAGDIRAEFDDIQATEAKKQQDLAAARSKILQFIRNVKNLDPAQLESVKRFEADLETELDLQNFDRLSTYLRLADDVATPDSDKVALAISGWFMGSNKSTPNLAIVESLYATRDLVLEYLQEETTLVRRKAILDLLRVSETGRNPDYIDAMLKNAKPVDEVNRAGYDGSKPFEFFVTTPGTKVSPDPWRFRCLAHLPPEYSPYKRYPMIVTLADGGTFPLETYLNIWMGGHNAALSSKLGQAVRNGHAARHGYIVVAVDWRSGNQRNYDNPATVHRVVNEALYHSLRKFSVDSDRVFLAGHGTGADAAYDIAAAHPEHFAGVVGYSGKMGDFVRQYSQNKHVNLPYYCVLGEKDYAARKSFTSVANRWLSTDIYNHLTLVHYQGRPFEYFVEDIPKAFEWMAGQTRRWPDKSGFEFSVDSLRRIDCYYWFLEMDGIPDKFALEPVLVNDSTEFHELNFVGKIKASDGGSNAISIDPRWQAVKNKTTLWLSPEYFDFRKRLVIQGRCPQKLDVKTSVETLLEDVLRRGDVEHPYWAAVDLINGNWQQR